MTSALVPALVPAPRAPEAAAAPAAAPPRWPLVALVVALVALPLGGRTLLGPLQVVQGLDLLVVAVVVAANLWRGRVPLPVPTPLLWGVGLLVVVLLSTATSVDPAVSSRQVVVLSVGLGLCCAVVAVCSDVRRWLVAVRALLLGGVLACGPALLSARELESHYGGAVVDARPVGVFAQPNELGAFAVLVALVALGAVLGGACWGRWSRRLAALALVVSAAALAVSLSRGAWIGAVLGGLALLLWVPRARRPVLGAAAAVVLAVAGLAVAVPSFTPVAVVVERVGSLVDGGDAGPYDDRPRIWAEAQRLALARPLLGSGPGAFEQASTQVDSVARTVGAEHAHDVLLTAAAETGVLGLVALLGLTLGCGLSVWRGLRAARGTPLLAPLAGTAAALLALLGQGLVDVPFKNALVAQTLWVVLGLALAGARLARRAHTPRPA